ncbi:beta-galactosidase [Segatella salivae]|uniref:Beta-galactosidase n=1 Tax=Segatella salivae F0493 TaxID=1395125 RepID=U2KL63_9BACT|nr:beta-galactosidase [Segatella salivae]ERJ99216.1 glycoside hydrolase, family 35 [Segatella salivae F0493]
MNRKFYLKTIIATLLFCLSTLTSQASGGDFTTGKNTFLLNGQPFVVKAAELHYPRIPRPYWDQRIKMCKALGMNTICLYVFWNIHEQQEGKYDFTGNNDVAAFCRLAQKNGMYVIVRPGPYVCAEWEMGGLPWWLLKKKDIRLREDDPYFMARVKAFETEVGRQLAPLTIQNGGPIIMVQVENEYGSYGINKKYVSQIRDIVKASGFDKVTLFQCDWASNFENNGLNDLLWTMNFGTGSNIDAQFKRLKQLRPETPLMCSEFWSGWFDKWGARHETRPAKAMVEGINEMLSKNISFSLYMTHGGTSFGHWAGANSPGFAPDVTSYDYDAPINEYGHATPKFWELRKTMQKYNGGKRLPDVPKPAAPIITIPKMTLTEFSPLTLGMSMPTTSHDIKSFEEMNLGWGAMFYETKLPQIEKSSRLSLNEAHDYAQIFINNKFIGTIDRTKNEKSIKLPPVKQGATLTILIEAMGRINFGRAVKDFKGITESVTIDTEINSHDVSYHLKNWVIAPIFDSHKTAQHAFDKLDETYRCFSPINFSSPSIGYYRGYFNLKKVGDTFLNLEQWGKGQVYVNGHALGRFWRIGPQQTLYLPGCWLKKGRNEIIVMDIVGPKAPVIWGQDQPELNKLQLEKTNKHNNPGDRPDLNSAQPVAQGALLATDLCQTIEFNRPAKGRYIAIECKNVHGTNDYVAIAELYALNAEGDRISRDSWSVKYADSEEEDGNHTGDKAFDQQETTYWKTQEGNSFPHLLVIDLGEVRTLTGLQVLSRTEKGSPGALKDYKIFVY